MYAFPSPTTAGTLRWIRRSRSTGYAIVCCVLLGLPMSLPARGGPGVPACGPAGPRPAYAPRAFLGYACRDELCNSHKAGFDWAERNGIADARTCATRNDPAFVEGCRAFADEAVTPEQAGFAWARENELEDPCHCNGAGTGFAAGCEAYVAGLAQ